MRAPAPLTRHFGDNKITWIQDENGNTVGVSAVLSEVFPTRTHPRSSAESRLATEIGQSGNDTDVGGHILGHLFLGEDSGRFNIVPQHGRVRTSIDSPNLNHGAYSKMENELADWIDHGMEVKLDIEVLDYVDGRPSSFGVRYKVIDPDTNKLVYDDSARFINGPEQEFNRFIRSDMQNKINEANGVI